MRGHAPTRSRIRHALTSGVRRALPAGAGAGEAAGAIALLVATGVALIWANLAGAAYDEFWHTPLRLAVGEAVLELDLRHLINDGLMAFFFALLALEVRREIELGELRNRRRAVVPVVAAIMGLAVPALVFVAFTAGTEEAAGWGVVVSTDTAFVLGLLALVGRFMPPQLRVFLVTLSVADDVGALAIIALVYTDEIRWMPLAVAVVGLAVVAGLRYLGVWRPMGYVVASLVIWAAVYSSGVHATLAGVAIALLLPIFPTRVVDVRDASRRMRRFEQWPSPEYARDVEERLQRAVSINERAHGALSPYVTFLVLPAFALANAGVHITPQTLVTAFGSSVTWGIIVALLLGKAVGIAGTALIAVAIRRDALGPGLLVRHIAAVSVVSGIGFTLSLFIAELAFSDPVMLSNARIGILGATVLAATAGSIAFALLGRAERRRASGGTRLSRPVDPQRDHLRGPAEAPITVVEYGSFASETCVVTSAVIAELRERFGADLRFVYRHLPIEGEAARHAALAAEAAARQGRFWAFHDALFDDPDGDDRVRRAAVAAGMNLRLFERDVRDRAGSERLDEDEADAAAMRLSRAPSIFLQGVLHDGPTDTETLIAAVQRVRSATSVAAG